jgi:SAM-dependent methyltransferase
LRSTKDFMTPFSTTDSSRLARERQFHNQRFAGGDNREAQLKYYSAVEGGASRYRDRVAQLAAGADVLEYGCGDADNYQRLGPTAKSLLAIDISDAAINRLAAANPYAQVQFRVMDAMQLDMAAQSVDLVFGSGIVHHLDTERSAREVARVLRPGGHAVFWEPLGLNPLINLYRWLTPSARTPDEHPLVPRDFRILRRHFTSVETRYYGLTSLASVPLRATAIGAPLRKALAHVDSLLLSVPLVKQIAWYALIECRR